MYDWWAAPIATHHSLAEVTGWFAKNQLRIERARPALDDPEGENLRRKTHGEVTVLGRCLGE
jgi:hypothetical protein